LKLKQQVDIYSAAGCLMISDLITQYTTLLNDYIWERYGDYLEQLGGKEYRSKVLDYVAKEDFPRSMNYQLDLTKNVGFSKVEILHKNMCSELKILRVFLRISLIKFSEVCFLGVFIRFQI
jgi:tRNA (cmo5U34)-methyltransferase